MKHISIFLVLFLVGVNVARAAVVINEVAWMGTSSSANAEWIELYNTDVESVLIDGWTLKAADGSPTINLTGTIVGQGYFLLERTSDETVPQITAQQIYSGSLGNNGEHLIIRNKEGVIVSEVDHSSGWLAGDNSNKQTMQLSGNNWITAIGTPGFQNEIVAPSVSETTSNATTTTATNTAEAESSIQEVKKDSDSEVIPVSPDPKFSAKVMSPSFGTVGVPVPFSVQVKQGTKKDLVSGRFEWYLGDGVAHRYYKNTSLSHVFYYPGTYTIVMEYYSDAFRDEPDSIHKKVITIVPDAVRIDGITSDGGLILRNDAVKEIDINQWVVTCRNNSFTFPKYTLVPKKGTLTISSEVTGCIEGSLDELVLYNQNNKEIDRFKLQNNE